jgi:hypothetical protein
MIRASIVLISALTAWRKGDLSELEPGEDGDLLRSGVIGSQELAILYGILDRCI